MRITRLAPSPTGALHLGNARTFVVNWVLARRYGWKVVLRIEDLDGPRVKQGADAQLIEDLSWLGLDCDEGPIYQSDRLAFYRSGIAQLIARGDAYPCICSRKEASAAASAPHAEDGSAVYPGTCRGKYQSQSVALETTGKPAALRFRVPDRSLTFQDSFTGPQYFNLSKDLGDFVIAKADGTPAYQLAVVMDDAAMGVSDVVRGQDLLDSTPRQILLYEALGLTEQVPDYYHLPLVVGTDGRRLAKRHGDTRLSYYRQRGVTPQRVTALLARWCGIDAGENVCPQELIRSLQLDAIPRHPIVFGPADDAWLLSGNS